MKVEIVKVNGKEAITVEGAVDLYSSPQLREAIQKLTAGKVNPLAIHLANVEYIDSSGIATLVEGLQATQKYNAKVVLVSASSKVKDVLELAHLDSIFASAESLEEAFA